MIEHRLVGVLHVRDACYIRAPTEGITQSPPAPAVCVTLTMPVDVLCAVQVSYGLKADRAESVRARKIRMYLSGARSSHWSQLGLVRCAHVAYVPSRG